MTDMTRERFENLAEAYGAEVARWPADTQDAAALLMAAEPGFVQAALSRAEALDRTLDVWAPLSPQAALRDAVIAAAPRARRRAPLAAWLWRAGLGAGLAAACAAGLIVGVGLSPEPQGIEAVTTVMNGFDDGATVGDV